MEDLTKRLNTEADQCANDGANDIATLLWEAAAVIEGLRTELANERASVHTCGPDCTRSGCVNARLRAELDWWKRLYCRAVNEANGLTNYVEDRPELRSAERNLAVIEAEARAALSNREGE